MPTALMRPGSKWSGAGAPTRVHKLRHSAIVLASTCSGWRVIAVVPRHWRNSMACCAIAPIAKPTTRQTLMRAPRRSADERGIRSEIVLKRDRTYEARPKLGLLDRGPRNHHDSLAQLRRPRLQRFHPMPDFMRLMRKSHSADFVSIVCARA